MGLTMSLCVLKEKKQERNAKTHFNTSVSLRVLLLTSNGFLLLIWNSFSSSLSLMYQKDGRSPVMKNDRSLLGDSLRQIEMHSQI